MKKFSHLAERLLGIYRWHPTIALRYLPIVEVINKMMGSLRILERLTILEVGSGGLGIVPYLKKRVVGLDISFSPPLHPDLIPVKGSAMDIPFAPDSFSIVVSTDMLEHLNQEERRRAISEMLRVAKQLICIGVPCGKIAQAQDAQLAEEYKAQHRREFDFFTEHGELRLPEKEEIEELIESEAKLNGKKILIVNRGTLNLRLRLWLMRGWISQNPLINLFFRKGLLLLIPFMRHMNEPPIYRQLFFVTISK